MLLAAYYILKVVRDTLIVTQSGAEATAYWTAGQAVLLLSVVPAYGVLASNTIRAALYLPTTREAKYKAKQAIDTFFARVGDMLQAGLIFVGVTYLGFGIRNFAMVNVGLCVAWLLVAGALYREHKRISREA